MKLSTSVTVIKPFSNHRGSTILPSLSLKPLHLRLFLPRLAPRLLLFLRRRARARVVARVRIRAERARDHSPSHGDVRLRPDPTRTPLHRRPPSRGTARRPIPPRRSRAFRRPRPPLARGRATIARVVAHAQRAHARGERVHLALVHDRHLERTARASPGDASNARSSRHTDARIARLVARGDGDDARARARNDRERRALDRGGGADVNARATTRRDRFAGVGFARATRSVGRDRGMASTVRDAWD